MRRRENLWQPDRHATKQRRPQRIPSGGGRIDRRALRPAPSDRTENGSLQSKGHDHHDDSDHAALESPQEGSFRHVIHGCDAQVRSVIVRSSRPTRRCPRDQLPSRLAYSRWLLSPSLVYLGPPCARPIGAPVLHQRRSSRSPFRQPRLVPLHASGRPSLEYCYVFRN